MASKGVNKVILIGNLGKDPDITVLPNGTTIANFTIATSETWKDKQSGQQQEKTEWHRVTAYKRLAEIVGEYLNKGSKVYIEGRLQTRKWQDKSGVDHYTTEIVANELNMIDVRQQNLDKTLESSVNEYKISEKQSARKDESIDFNDCPF